MEFQTISQFQLSSDKLENGFIVNALPLNQAFE